MQWSGQDCQTALVPCCGHKVDLLPAFPSRVVPLPSTRLSTRRSSVPFSFAACGSPCPRLAVFGGVAVHSIPVATTAACAVAEVLGSRWFALESAATRVCREAGGRVTTNSRIQDMDIVAPNQLDERRIEVLADVLLLFHGAQVAVDTTLVSALRRDGTHDLDVLTSMARLWRLPVEGRTSISQNSPGDRGERHWLSWRPKWEEGGHRRRRTFCSNWPKQKRHEPKVMRVSAQCAVVEKVEVFCPPAALPKLSRSCC